MHTHKDWYGETGNVNPLIHLNHEDHVTLSKQHYLSAIFTVTQIDLLIYREEYMFS
jgi:hypothetical protein